MAQQPIILPSKKIRRQQVTLNLPGAAITPSAQPIDTYYRTNVPKPEPTEALQIAQALAPFSESLGQYLEFEKGYLQKEASAQAELDVQQWSTDQLTAVATMSREELIESGFANVESGARPDYFVTMKLNAGKRLMQIGMEDLITKYGEIEGDLTDPNGDADIAKQMSELRKEFMGKFKEMGFYVQQGASAILDPQIDHLRKKAISSRTTRTEDENVENLTVGISDAMMTVFANDDVADAAELTKYFETISEQLALFKNVGGEDTNDMAFEGLERTAMVLAEEHPDGDHAIALLKLAETTLGPGTTIDNVVALAAPGTKNHERLLKLRERVEEKMERHQDKQSADYWEKKRRAGETAGNRISKYFVDLEDAEGDPDVDAPDDGATEIAIVKTYTDLGLDPLDAQDDIIEYRNLLETEAETVTDADVLESVLARISRGEVIDNFSQYVSQFDKSDFRMAYQLNEANKRTPERNQERQDAERVLTQNLLAGFSANDYGATEWAEIGPALTSIIDLMRTRAKPARGTTDLWEAYIASMKRADLPEVLKFREEHEDALANVKGRQPATIKNSARVRGLVTNFLRALEGSVDENKFPDKADFAAREVELRRMGTLVINDELTKTVNEVIANGVPTLDIPEAVATTLDNKWKDMWNRATGEPQPLPSSTAVTPGLGGPPLPVIFRPTADGPSGLLPDIDTTAKESYIGHDYNISGGAVVRVVDSLDAIENAQWLTETVSLRDRDPENWNEKRKWAADNREQLIRWVKGVNHFWGSGGETDYSTYNTATSSYMWGDQKLELRPTGFGHGGGWLQGYSPMSSARLPMDRASILPTYRALWKNIGLPYGDIADKGLDKALSLGESAGKKGLKPGEINLGEMPLDMGVDMDPEDSRNALDAALTEYREALEGVPATATSPAIPASDPRHTTLGKFMEELNIPVFYTDRNGDKRTNAELLVTRQKILWGGRF